MLGGVCRIMSATLGTGKKKEVEEQCACVCVCVCVCVRHICTHQHDDCSPYFYRLHCTSKFPRNVSFINGASRTCKLGWEPQQIDTSARAPGQDGHHVQLCGFLLVRAFLQSISQLIEWISITKGFLLSQRTLIHGGEEDSASDSPRKWVLGNANVCFHLLRCHFLASFSVTSVFVKHRN